MNDLLIIGGGPAGSAAGVYAARKRLKTVLITEEFGGQSSVSADIQNFIGIPHVPGAELSKMFREHLEEYADEVLEIVDGERVEELKEVDGGFEAKTNKGNTYKAKAVLAASGSRRRKLPAEGAERLDGKGVVYCASCDAPLFKDMDVVVVGGGNAGFESAQQLTEYAKSILLLEMNDEFRADPVTREKVLSHDKVTAKLEATIKEIKGDKFVSSVVYEDKEGEHEIDVQGVFVEIGSIPNNDYIKDMVETNKIGEVVVDHKTQRASKEGIWAAGDLSDVLYKQNNISMGDGVKALEDIYIWIQKQK
ncbi:MAG: FAD-dependent oxidoreductase [Candidatus Spechtbacterales bacterium]|nr:FAD-dependent oxidoreductase [Candidatus Spechtbacterales bacterium]